MSDSAPNLPPAKSIASWRILLRGAGVWIALFVFCFWAAKGYHRGWSQNRVLVTQIDPITEIKYPTYEDRFVPGVEFLGAGIVFGALVFAATFFGRRSPKTPSA